MPQPPNSDNREIGDLLSRACHDLRAPVRAIRAHAELFLRDGASADDFAQRLGFIVDGARKIDLLVDALSSYSIALQILPSLFQPAPMAALLRTALAKLNDEIRANTAEVTYGELPRVQGNPDRLLELLQRLLQNALQHRGATAPRVHLTATKQAESWLFAVADNGPGLEAADLERIFRPFERLNRSSVSGTGMGLAICRAIVERHGGTIWAESEDGSGATFLFTLPTD